MLASAAFGRRNRLTFSRRLQWKDTLCRETTCFHQSFEGVADAFQLANRQESRRRLQGLPVLYVIRIFAYNVLLDCVAMTVFLLFRKPLKFSD